EDFVECCVWILEGYRGSAPAAEGGSPSFQAREVPGRLQGSRRRTAREPDRAGCEDFRRRTTLRLQRVHGRRGKGCERIQRKAHCEAVEIVAVDTRRARRA